MIHGVVAFMIGLIQFSVLGSQFSIAKGERFYLDSISIHLCCEGESECTSERARGQFSIFGAVEEKCCPGCLRIDMIKKLVRYVA